MLEYFKGHPIRSNFVISILVIIVILLLLIVMGKTSYMVIFYFAFIVVPALVIYIPYSYCVSKIYDKFVMNE